MPFTSRSRRSRWLRLVLAVLALVASHVSIARSALGATCARASASIGTDVVTAVSAAAPHGSALRGTAPDAPHDAPAPSALASHCAPSAVVLPPLVDVPAAVTAWDASPPPTGPEARPASHAPPPPFHPPRAI